MYVYIYITCIGPNRHMDAYVYVGAHVDAALSVFFTWEYRYVCMYTCTHMHTYATRTYA